MTPRKAASLGSLIFVPTLVTQPAAAKEVKIGATNRVGATLFAVRNGLIDQ